MIYVIVFLISLMVTLFMTPVAKKLAFLLKAIDHPNDRKVHSYSMPRLGGVAIFSGFMIAVIFGISMALLMHMRLNYLGLWGILIGASFILLVGIVDDMRGISASRKLVLQIIAAAIPMFFGVQITWLSVPVTGIILLGVFSIPFTILWVVGFSNALNFIDGLDGLASGITAIAAITLFLVAIRIHQPGAAILLIALAGAAIGFLRYNFNPASIFLGDSGSLFLGYILAVSSVVGVLKSTIFLALLIPIMILAIPIFDAASVILRRVKDGRHIFDADRRHLHHRLLDRGFSHKQVVVSIYVACIALSIGALITTYFGVGRMFMAAGIAASIVLAATIIVSIKNYIKRFVVLEK